MQRPTAFLRLGALCMLGFPSLAQESTAYFDAPVVAASYLSRFEALLDLDGDGDLDALGLWWGNVKYDVMRVHGYINEGDGSFSWGWFEKTAGAVGGIYEFNSAVGDVNLDGRDDFVYSNGDTVWVFRTEAPGDQPMTMGTYGVTGSIGGVALGDFVGGPELDLLVATTDLYVFPNAGGVSFGAPTVLPIGAQATELLVGDVNGDGAPDVMVEHGGTVQMIDFLGGAAILGDSYAHGVADAMPAFGDIDGDGDEDYVAFGMGGYSVVRRTGPGSFVVEPVAAGGPATGLADADGDGDLDGVCCGGSGGAPPTAYNTQASAFEIALNDGSGGFAPAFSIPGLGSDRLAGAADLDGDGDVDLVGGRCVYYSRGGITAPPIETVEGPVGPFGVADNALADVEGDGDIDFEVGIDGMLANSAGGTTTATASLLLDPMPQQWSFGGPGFPGDFDGDGDVDLIVGLYIDGVFDAMQLLANAGGGGFLFAGPASSPGVNFNLQDDGLGGYLDEDQPEAGIVGDIDGDGDLDLVTRRSSVLWESQVWINDGAGFFTAGANIANRNAEAIADINGDGIPDLVTLAYTLYIFYGNGDGTFGGPNAIPGITTVDAGLERAVVRDLDGDGDLDTASIHRDDGIGGIAWNDGAGNFTWETFEHLMFAVRELYAPSPSRTFALEVNDDGLLDVVVFPARTLKQDSETKVDQQTSAWIGVRAADGEGWETIVQQIMDVSAPVDLDGDGDVDLVGPDLVRNTLWSGDAAGASLQYGDGLAGTGGVVPVMGGQGPFRAGEAAELRLRASRGGTLSWLAFSGAPAATVGLPVASATAWIDLNGATVLLLPTFGAPGVAGEGSWTLPYVVPPVIGGLSFYHQAFTLDPAAPEAIAASNGYRIDYGF